MDEATHRAYHPTMRDVCDYLESKGKIKHREDIQEGIANCPQTLNRLFTGENKGKQLLKI